MTTGIDASQRQFDALNSRNSSTGANGLVNGGLPRPTPVSAKQATTPPRRFTPKQLADLLTMPAKQWLIEQIIGLGDLAMLYGPPGSGKTFVVIDLIFSACLGTPFAQRFAVTRPLNVAYCAGEGVSGLPTRFAAAATYYGVQALPTFTFYESVPQLFSTPALAQELPHIQSFVQEWQLRQAAGEAQPLDLLIIDTLHSAIDGADENSSKDIGRVLHLIRWANKVLGCAVLLVHHTNKQGTGERGSSALRGAMDCMLEVKPSAGKFVLCCEKLKDGQQWSAQPFDLVTLGESVRLWWDEVTALRSATGKKDLDKAHLLAELHRYPTVRFTVKRLAEAIVKSENYTRNLLSELEHAGDCERTLSDESKPQSNRNPWVYGIPADPDHPSVITSHT